uniref:Reticulon 4 receptor like 1 n=1 Tax=Podarcis muralis TaxID=64176 RepID=A0A670JT66_PODMU
HPVDVSPPLSPLAGSCLELSLLLLLALELPSSGGCPTDCVCYPSPMTVSCQSHNFLAIPEGIPEDSERVFLQNNQISLLLRGHFSPSLVTLWLYSNNVTFVDPNAFRGFSHLEELDLGDNPNLQELSAKTFQGLSRLHALHLYKCGLSSLPSGIFSGLHNLQYLYLQDNRLANPRLATTGQLLCSLRNPAELRERGSRIYPTLPGLQKKESPPPSPLSGPDQLSRYDPCIAMGRTR